MYYPSGSGGYSQEPGYPAGGYMPQPAAPGFGPAGGYGAPPPGQGYGGYPAAPGPGYGEQYGGFSTGYPPVGVPGGQPPPIGFGGPDMGQQANNWAPPGGPSYGPPSYGGYAPPSQSGGGMYPSVGPTPAPPQPSMAPSYGSAPAAPSQSYGAAAPYGSAHPTQPYGAAPSAVPPYGSAPSAVPPYGSAPSSVPPYGSAPSSVPPYGSAPSAVPQYGAAPSAVPPYGSAAAATGYHGGAPSAPGYMPQSAPMALTGVASEYERMKQYGNVPHGTVRPFPGFNAEADSKVLRKAMKGIGTDEKAIISVVAYRSNAQRQEIKRMFKTMFGKDLIRELESETSGNFRDALIALFSPPIYYDAWSLFKATEGVGTKEGVLIEILFTRTNQEIRAIAQMYKSEFHRDLERDIANDTSGHFKRLLVSACQGNRNELNDAMWQRVTSSGPESVVDRARAQQDAHALLQAGEARWGTDESCFNEIMSVRNYFQLRATFEEYAKIAARNIMSTVEREFSGDIKEGLLAIVKVAQCRPLYFAERLYHAMRGAGTNDSALIRVLVSRCEVDLADIKRCYAEKYHTTLAAAVQSETSGDYKTLLLALVGRD